MNTINISDTETISKRLVFENFCRCKIPNSKDKLKWDEVEGGYEDDIVNAVWIGFNAGVILSDCILTTNN